MSTTLPGEDTQPLTERERKLLNRLLSDPTVYPMTFKSWLVPFLEGTDMDLPMSAVHRLTDTLFDLAPKAQELHYAETLTPLIVAASTTGTVLTTTALIPVGVTEVLVAVSFPCFAFTDTAGGEGEIIVDVGSPPTGYVLGRMWADRELAWPAQATRKVPIPVTGSVDFTLKVMALSGTLELNAGGGYGAITLRVFGR